MMKTFTLFALHGLIAIVVIFPMFSLLIFAKLLKAIYHAFKRFILHLEEKSAPLPAGFE